ncbi:alpha/beta-hydrolase [Glonium stellatum]|uniref:Alpha/beta-hydrolase n=1 Tax=Glonium stellatum TaxID=574774 RepID=A0A8E2FAY5_9PEZI|nr:alpha/beta-hydrolase [Glonium stellatum]
MTFHFFGKGSGGKRKHHGLQKPQKPQKPQNPPKPQAVSVQEYRPSQSTLNMPSASFSPPIPTFIITQSHQPKPVNHGWSGNASSYPQQQLAGAQVPQPHLPLRPSSSQSNNGLYRANHQSSTNLASSYPPQNDSRWKSSLNLSVLQQPIDAASASFTNLQDTLHSKSTCYLNQSAALCDLISSKLNAVITSMDGELFSGDETELAVYQPQYSQGLALQGEQPRGVNNVYPSTSANPSSGSNYFSKAWLYANSRLPPHLPPFKVYMPTYPLLCLAAQFSERVYTRPTGAERETHVDANWRHGTKAMVLKSVPIDDMNTVVFAIRGSQTFMDWAVNFRPAPSSPEGFLDDPGNLCHTGFLHVARQMISPVAARLRTLLQENPSRSNCSLLITGHSAGGAVASLLYAHMMSTTVSSELNHLTGFFKRVHCVTFGAPPVSLLPLNKPTGKQHEKNLFLSFINEGDPVPRADKTVVSSLLKLYASPAPNSTCDLATSNSWPIPGPTGPMPVWKIPPSTLSTAGRLVLLRIKPGAVGEQNIEACVVTDEQLREVVFGDPMCHMMNLYANRIEILATRAVTAKSFS